MFSSVIVILALVLLPPLAFILWVLLVAIMTIRATTAELVRTAWYTAGQVSVTTSVAVTQRVRMNVETMIDLQGQFLSWLLRLDKEAKKGDYDEACLVLALKGDFSIVDFDQKYKAFMRRAHPDTGGTEYMAMKGNWAKDVIERARGW